MAKEQKSISEMTVKELKKYITKQTKKANTRLRNIEKRKRGVSKAVSEELDVLRKKGIIGKRDKAVLNFRTKTKTELQAQARELEYFNQWTGAEVSSVSKDKDYKKYQSFINNPRNKMFANYSYQDWRDLVNMFGTMEDKLQEFEYEDMKRLHIEATNKGIKKDLVSAMVEAKRQSKELSKTVTVTTDTLTDLVRSELFV